MKPLLLTLPLILPFSFIDTKGQNSFVKIKKNKVKEYGGNSIRISSQKEQLDKVFKPGLNALVNLPFYFR
jgi:hypothetical protein